MKVVFCTNDGKNIINGVNTWLLRLLPHLKAKGIIIQVILIAWAPEEECTVIPILKSMGIVCTIIKAKRYTEQEIKWILEYVKEEAPDIFVVNGMFQAWYASKWIQEAGIPVIGVLHNDDIESEEKIKTFAAGKNGYLIDRVVAVSDVLFNKALQYQSKVKRIPYGVTIPTNKSSYKKGEIFKIVYSGRLELPQKRIDIVTRAFCEAVTHIQGVEAYIYGSGPEEENMQRIIKEYNTDKVILKGNVSNEELVKEIGAMHVISLMSAYEGLPVSLIEAMSAGVVPICKYIPSGIPELLIEDFNGFYTQNINDFVERIIYLKNNPETWESLSKNAKSLVAQKYSIEECVDQWCQLFGELDRSKKRPLKIPFKINLPPINTGITSDDNREPGLFIKAIRKTKRMISRPRA